jgi:hypothetical protein
MVQNNWIAKGGTVQVTQATQVGRTSKQYILLIVPYPRQPHAGWHSIRFVRSVGDRLFLRLGSLAYWFNSLDGRLVSVYELFGGEATLYFAW